MIDDQATIFAAAQRLPELVLAGLGVAAEQIRE